jgi:hypothetical protein
MSSIEFYNDGDVFVAAVDGGSLGFWKRRGAAADSGEWRFVMPGGIEWDALRQDLYYAGHDLDPCPSELAATLPPLPPVPDFKRMEWKDNFEPEGPLLAAEFPALAARLSASPQQRGRLWFILEESLYETRFGDGCFPYFHGRVFDEEAAALSFVAWANEETERLERETGQVGTGYQAKPFGLRLEGDRLSPEGHEPVRPEDYRIERILRRIEATIASEGALPWGTKEGR